MSHLLCIETAIPQHRHSQKAVADFYCAALPDNSGEAQRKIRAVSRHSGISNRYSVLGDFTGEHPQGSFFPQKESRRSFPNLNERMLVFRKEALNLSLAAVNKIDGFAGIKDRLTHIITVTCTGLFAPGLDIELMKALGLRNSIHRSSVNFMGCNAAVLALRQAHQVCAHHPEALVLIVCTELCTLHFQNESSDDYILSNMLFGDGSAAVLVGGTRLQLHSRYQPLSIRAFQSLIIPEGHNDMAWQISERGFIMNLSSYVSGLLNGNISGMLAAHGILQREIRHWAIHPGGKKILDEFCGALSLGKEQLKHSYHVLKHYGNMSSATILFVLQELLSGTRVNEKEKIYAAAFGPGLSIESAVLENV